MKQPYLILLFVFSLQLYAQEERIMILGEVENNSSGLENVHILNLNSNIGTVSNQFGVFRMLIKLNDTIIFSNIQYKTEKLIIKKEHLSGNSLKIKLEIKINELDEIVLKNHNLSGSLTNDSKLLKDSISAGEKIRNQILKINFNKPIVLYTDDEDREKPPDASKLTNPNVPVGGNILGLLNFALDPLFNEVGKIGKTKRDFKNKERAYYIQAEKAPDKIREELGDQFFTETLNIPVEQIEAFINYCEPKGIIKLYLENKKIEMIDIFLIESQTFNQTD